MALTDGLVHQADVNTRGRSDDAPFDHVEGLLGSNIGGSFAAPGEGGQTVIQYNGTNGRSDLPTPAGLPSSLLNGPFSMAVRMSATATAQTAAAFAFGDNAAAIMHGVLGLGNNTLAAFDFRSLSGGGWTDRVGTILNQGEVVLVVTRDATNQWRSYLDGVEVDTRNVSSNDFSVELLAWGALNRANNFIWHLTGTVAWSAAWTRTLDPAEVASLSDSENPFLISPVDLNRELTAQWDVNQAGRADNDFYEWVNGTVEASVGAPTVDVSGTTPALLYNGVDQYTPVNYAASQLANPNNDFTLAARIAVTPPPGPNIESVIGWGVVGDPEARVVMSTDAQEVIKGSHVDGNGSNFSFLNPFPIGVLDGTEAVVVFLKRGTDLELYLNGAQVQSGVVGAWNNPTWDRFNIAAHFYQNAIDWFFAGRVHWGAAYSRALIQAEISALGADPNPWRAAQPGIVSPANVNQDQALDAPGVSQDHQLAVADVNQLQLADPVTIIYQDFVSPAHLVQLQLNDGVVITQEHQLDPASLAQLQQIEGPAISTVPILLPANLDQLQVLDPPGIDQEHVIRPRVVTSFQEVDLVQIGQEHQLDVVHIHQDQRLSLVTLDVPGVITPNFVRQVQELGGVVISTEYTLQPRDLFTLQSIRAPSLVLPTSYIRRGRALIVTTRPRALRILARARALNVFR